MADATTSVAQLRKTMPEVVTLDVADAIELFAGVHSGIRGEDHPTTQGDLDHSAPEKGQIYGGFVHEFEDTDGFAGLDRATGDATPAGGKTAPKAGLTIAPQYLTRFTVATVASAADVGKYVYALDSSLLTLVRPTLGNPMGFVAKHHSGTTCDVITLGLIGQILLGAAGQAQELIYLGSINFTATGLADGDLKTGIPMPYHGEILEVFSITEEPLVGAGGTSLINLELGGVDVTGGVVTVATATQATLGTKSVGTPVTALNAFHEGDLLDVEASATGGTITNGRVGLYITVQKRSGA